MISSMYIYLIFIFLLHFYPNYLGSSTHVLNFHSYQFSISLTHTPTALVSFSIVTNQLFFGLSFFFYLRMFIFIIILTAFCFILPHHMPKPYLFFTSQFSLIYYRRYWLNTTSPMGEYVYSFLFLSYFVISLIHLSIFISVTLILCSVVLSTTQYFESYNIIGFTIFL